MLSPAHGTVPFLHLLTVTAQGGRWHRLSNTDTANPALIQHHSHQFNSSPARPGPAQWPLTSPALAEANHSASELKIFAVKKSPSLNPSSSAPLFHRLFATPQCLLGQHIAQAEPCWAVCLCVLTPPGTGLLWGEFTNFWSHETGMDAPGSLHSSSNAHTQGSGVVPVLLVI